MITLKNLTFGYADKLIFDDLSATLDSSWKMVLVGKNGRGKTTLMKLLTGELSGAGQIDSDQSFIYFPQKINDTTQLTQYVLDELYAANEWEIRREMNILGLSETILWQPFDTLSGGEQTKVLLIGLFLNDAYFPLIDEPTNHLDMASRKQVANYLKQQKSGYIVTSHDRRFLEDVGDHLLAIERNDIQLLKTTYSGYELDKKRRDDFEWSQNSKLKSEISRLKQSSTTKADWSQHREKEKSGNPKEKGSGGILDKGFIGARAARQMKKAKGLRQRMDKEINAKALLLKNIEKVDQLTMCYIPTHHHRLIDEADIQLNRYDRTLFNPINIQLKQGEVIAITGENGIGKSLLIKHIYQIAIKKNLQVSYLSQIEEDNQGDLLSFSEKYQLDYRVFLNNLRKLGMERHVFQQKIEHMSLGQQKKVALAKSLSEPATLYIWDEPLNYLDVDNQYQLEALLKLIKPTMIIVEHDAEFIGEVADQIIELEHRKNQENK